MEIVIGFLSKMADRSHMNHDHKVKLFEARLSLEEISIDLYFNDQLFD